MTVTALQLADYVGAASPDDYITECLSTAQTAVDQLISASPMAGSDGVTVGVPLEVQDRAVLEVGSELYHRKNAPNGVAQFAALDGSPIRVARDPMVAARPILAAYLGGGFG